MGLCGSKHNSSDAGYVSVTSRTGKADKQNTGHHEGLQKDKYDGSDENLEQLNDNKHRPNGYISSSNQFLHKEKQHLESSSADIEEILKNPVIKTAVQKRNANDSDSSSTTGNKKSNDIDKYNDVMASQPNVEGASKVLLLGAGESGKSTVLQQLRILHQNGFTEKERISYRPSIYGNLLEIGNDIMNARNAYNIPLETDSNISLAQIEEFINYFESSETEVNLNSLTKFPSKLTSTLDKLTNLPSTKELMNGSNNSSLYLMDSASYFLENLYRISKQDYIPTDDDILRSRQKTSGIFDMVLNLDSDLKLNIYDVGGQRSERKKWIHCFNNVTLVIFCVSLSEYDQFLLEDQTQNRFQESLVLFDNIINSRWFARTSVVLFLNKVDVFAEKLKKVPLETYFPDYTGGQDINKAAKYILWRFVQLNRANLNIYPHVTQATDTSNINLVFEAIKGTILQNNLNDSGVL